MSNPPKAGDFWDREIVAQTHVSWMQHPRVREYINRLIGNGEMRWPFDWFVEYLGARRFRRGLSIGCGGGALERDLIKRGICETVDAFDGSTHSLYLASQEAEKEGFGKRIRYFAADFNEPAFPRSTYDVVFFHQSLHHVAKLEKLMRAVMRTLTRDGLLYVDEYIGPSRTDWSEELIAPHRAVAASLPEGVVPNPDLGLPIQADDPSEAVRSGEIEEQLAVGFDLLARRDYGGAILSVLFPNIDANAADESVLDQLIAADRAMLERGNSYHAVMVLRAKRGLSGAVARANYFFVPKYRGVRLRVAHKLGRESKF